MSLERIPEKEIVKNLLVKLEKNPTKLDLSLSPSPEKMLASISSWSGANKIKKIDLSFSKITEVTELITLLKGFSALEEITLSHYDMNLIKALRDSNLPTKITMRITANELELVGSKNFIERTQALKPKSPNKVKK